MGSYSGNEVGERDGNQQAQKVYNLENPMVL